MTTRQAATSAHLPREWGTADLIEVDDNFISATWDAGPDEQSIARTDRQGRSR